MKRAAAIIGPTPSFVRWAIRHDCPFRQIDMENLPYQTFQQLRGLREISVGSLEHRIVNRICIHGEANLDPESARGFPVDEVVRLFGESDRVAQTCGSCPANAARWFAHDSVSTTRRSEPVWAGCYGWLAAVSESVDFPELFEHCVNDNDSELLSGFAEAASVWFRIWQTAVWNASQLTELSRILQLVDSQLTSHPVIPDFRNLCFAVDACLRNQLVLETELVPLGNSDGLHWRIEPHCPRCRCEMRIDSRICDQCGNAGRPRDAVQRKVLGFRPYMLLKDILGKPETENLLARFREMKQL